MTFSAQAGLLILLCALYCVRGLPLITYAPRGEEGISIAYYMNRCQFSDFSLISDFLRIKKTCIKLIKSGQNIDKFSIVSKGRLDNSKGLDNLGLQFLNIKTSLDFLQTKFRLSE